MSREGVLQLSAKEAFASGTFRNCFYHPEHADRCIKVDKRKWRKSATAKEIRFLERPIIRHRFAQGVPMAEYHGWCETNLGVGSIFSIVRDADGSISKTLQTLVEGGLSPDDLARLDPAFQTFKKRLLRAAVICRDLRPWNICVRERAGLGPAMILVDGFGHRNFPPVHDYVPSLARRKIRQHFYRFGFGDLATLNDMYAKQTYPPVDGTA